MCNGPVDDHATETADVGAPVALDSPRGRWLLAVAVLGSAVAQLEATVVTIALPAIGADLDADVSALQWVLNSYLLTLAGLILIGGSLGDRFGRRRVFVIGVVLFTATSVGCAAAPTVEVLVATRALQGVGGALLTPGSLAMLEAVLRPEDRARAIGAWSALGGVAAALGPVLGGWLVELSWRWVFVLPVPLGVVVAVAAVTKVPESRDLAATGRVDVGGAVLVTGGLAAVTFALVQAPVGPTGVVATLGALGVVALAAFWRYELGRPDPMLDPAVFASRTFTVANVLTFVVYAGLGGVFFLFAIFLQVSLGYPPLHAGAASLPITALMLVLSSRAGAWAERAGPRWPLTVGPLLIAAGMLLMLRISPGDGYVSHVLPAVVVLGLGLSATVAPVTATALAAADERHAGMASGVNNAVARTAQLAAVAALPFAVGLSGEAYADPVALADAFHRAMIITAALALSGAVLAAVAIRSDVRHPAPPRAHHLCCGVDGPPQRPSTPEPAGIAGHPPPRTTPPPDDSSSRPA